MTPPRLLEQVRAEIRARHYSRRTEDAYAHWIRRFIVFHGRRHPRELGAPEISAFLTWLAVEQHVAASTQNQALSGVLFLYREVLRPVSRPSGSRHNSRAGHPASRRCSSLRYSRYPRSSRLAIRAPRPGLMPRSAGTGH